MKTASVENNERIITKSINSNSNVKEIKRITIEEKSL
jgi:hypothetical protein